jgi:hypothetical protein
MFRRKVQNNRRVQLTSPGLLFCSVFYVFYEQYLTIWEDTYQSLGLSLAAVFVATLVLTGFDVFSAVIVLVMVAMVVVNLGGFMYWWNVSLNAVSLVNLVMVSDVTVTHSSDAPAPGQALGSSSLPVASSPGVKRLQIDIYRRLLILHSATDVSKDYFDFFMVKQYKRSVFELT